MATITVTLANGEKVELEDGITIADILNRNGIATFDDKTFSFDSNDNKLNYSSDEVSLDSEDHTF